MLKILKKIISTRFKAPDNFLEGIGFLIEEKGSTQTIRNRLLRIRLTAVLSLAVVVSWYLLIISDLGADEELIEAISKLMVLPDEEPTIAIITDYDSVSSNPFYKDAKEEDVVLLFKESRKAILYSKKLDKILNTGFIEEAGVITE